MKFLESLKIDTWWKVVLLLGVGAIFMSLTIKAEFIQNKHLFGIGIGMLLISISYWIAEKKFSTIKPPNVYTGPTALISWKEIHHNPITSILLMLGFIFICLFGFLIVKNLI
jgi:hypothetical protein